MPPQNEKPTPSTNPVPSPQAETPTATVQSSAPSPASPTTPSANSGLIGLTGSQLAPEKVRLPKGVYVLVGIGAIAFLISFFDTSQNSLFYTIDMFLVLVATIGLLLRLELARRMLVILSGITIVLSVVLVLGFMGLQNRLKDHRQRYDTAVAQLNERSLNATQKQQLDSLTKQLDTLEKQVGKTMQLTYIKYGLTIVAYAGAMVYLTRPGVRQSFRKDL